MAFRPSTGRGPLEAPITRSYTGAAALALPISTDSFARSFSRRTMFASSSSIRLRRSSRWLTTLRVQQRLEHGIDDLVRHVVADLHRADARRQHPVDAPRASLLIQRHGVADGLPGQAAGRVGQTQGLEQGLQPLAARGVE